MRPFLLLSLLTLTTSSLAEPLHGLKRQSGRGADNLEAARQRPKVIRYDAEHTHAPPGYVYNERPNRGLMISGLAIFGTFWGVSVLASQTPNNSWLAVPLIGPFIAMQQEQTRGPSCSNDANAVCANSTNNIDGVYIFLGGSQILGAALFGMSFAKPARYYVRESALSVLPYRTSSGFGLVAQGRF